MVARVKRVAENPFGIHADQHDLVNRAGWYTSEARIERVAGNGVVQQAANSKVVDETAIDKMDVWAFFRIPVALRDEAQNVRREVLFGGGSLQHLIRLWAAAGVVAHRHRTQQHGYRRRGG